VNVAFIRLRVYKAREAQSDTAQVLNGRWRSSNLAEMLLEETACVKTKTSIYHMSSECAALAKGTSDLVKC